MLYSKHAGTEVKLDGVEHLIMREDDILGILAKPNNHFGHASDHPII